MTDLQGGPRIAIVDDEKEMVKMLEEALRLRGIRACFTAFDGDEAVLKFVKSSPMPDILIMDYRMPIVNGLQATREILRIKPDMRIIILSADADIEEEALKAGAVAFLKKPASIKGIYHAIDATTGNVDRV
jgi:two-component system chemotaxis response regulator CheY